MFHHKLLSHQMHYKTSSYVHPLYVHFSTFFSTGCPRMIGTVLGKNIKNIKPWVILILIIYYWTCLLPFPLISQRNKLLFRCAMTKLKACGKTFFFFFNAVNPRHNDHFKTASKTPLYFITQPELILCTILAMIYELDKQTKNIDLWVVTRKIEWRTPKKSSKMCSCCHIFIFLNV